VPTFDLIWSLIAEFKGTRRLIFFGLMDQFKREVFDAEVWGPNYRTMSLKEALLKVAALEKSKQ
jgi:hypothetical protein